MNALQKRLFEEARKRNPELKIPAGTAPPTDWTEADLALVKQGVGDKTGRQPGLGQGSGEGGSNEPAGPSTGSIVTYFEAKGFGFLRPDDGGRDIFFHISRLVDVDPTLLKPGARVEYELGMDRTGKMAASSVRMAPEPEK